MNNYNYDRNYYDQPTSPPPLSPPPQARPPQSPLSSKTRPTSHGRSFSFRSDKSAGSGSKIDLHETSKDKRRMSATTKNNPNAAMIEAQPAEQANDATTAAPLRGMQFKDSQGNVITDADSSNPTRHRMERPLDTIRSFESNIEASYKKRGTADRSQPAESVIGHAGPRSNFMGNTGGYNKSFNQRNEYHARPSHQRMMSAPLANSVMPEDEVYHGQDYYEHDVPYGPDSSGSASEPWGNTTDPSSENSSVDRMQAGGGRYEYNDSHRGSYARGPPMKDPYAYPPQQPRQSTEYPAQARQPQYGYPSAQAEQQHMGPPPPPPPPKHDVQRNVVPLGERGPPPPNMQPSYPPRKAQPQTQPGRQMPPSGSRLTKTASAEKPKRKSWLSRRFSKG